MEAITLFAQQPTLLLWTYVDISHQFFPNKKEFFHSVLFETHITQTPLWGAASYKSLQLRA